MTAHPMPVTGRRVVHGLAGLANAQQNCWPMILELRWNYGDSLLDALASGP